jgi:NADP-dependent 3-hydroxy acid dehydrogenase YdfG
MQDFLLTDKTILITGASSGIGKAAAILLHKWEPMLLFMVEILRN